jgi:hypothetical protein
MLEKSLQRVFGLGSVKAPAPAKSRARRAG